MTATERATAAGVFIVRDPDVCAALEQLLAPHRTINAPAPAVPDSFRADELMAEAEARVQELTGEPASALPSDATIEQLLDFVHRDGQTLSNQELSDARDEGDALTERLRDTEAALHRADCELTATSGLLRDALAKITGLETEAATVGREKELADAQLAQLRSTIAGLHADLDKARQAPAPSRASGSRVVDKKAFTDLADRMDNQALTQAKAVGDVLRLAARAVRDEIHAVYGNDEKKAS